MVLFLVCLAVFYMWHMLGTTIGYHRLLSHCSFRCPKAVEYFWILGGYLAFEGSPIWWAVMHRAHHRWVDTRLDPHSPRFGLFQAYSGWTTRGHYPEHIDPTVQAKDLFKDPVYKFLEFGGNWYYAFTFTVVVGLLFRVILFIFFGWQVMLASFVAAFVAQNIPLLLNVVCHIPKLGYRTYALNDDSVNVWWMALLTMGEGWHNNHHAFPGSARAGLKMHEVDMSWLTLRFLKLFGLVGWTNEPDLSPAVSGGGSLPAEQELVSDRSLPTTSRHRSERATLVRD